MHSADIKAALTKAGYSMTDVADQLDVRVQSVHDVIHGVKTSARIKERISQLTGISVQEIWPEPDPVASSQ